MSTKNPTIRRILKEAAELNASPATDYHAAPLETDLFEWHFTMRGPPAPSSFDGGLYHGRIVLPPAYPLKPPSFRFTTPTGRFEVNREICLSISGHHEETWQPAWGIRTALVAIRSFMDTDAKGQVGGMDASVSQRRRLASQSSTFKCTACGKSNHTIMEEHDALVAAAGSDAVSKQETVPEELRLAYREDLKSDSDTAVRDASVEPVTTASASTTTTTHTMPRAGNNVTATATIGASQSNPISSAAATTPQHTTPARTTAADDGLPAWIDKTIYGLVLALIAMIWIKFG